MLMVLRQGRNFSFLDKSELIKLKMKAMRSGAWFKALRRIDRVLVDLTIKVTCNVHSIIILTKSILAIKRKLHVLLESELSRTNISIGFPTAYEPGVFAQKWGNTNAREWANDVGFIRYIAIMQL